MVHNQHDKLKSNPQDIKGNPRALNQRKVEKICNLIRCGNYVKPSVQACDVNYNTFLSCMNKGKKGVQPYEDWYYMIEQAKADFETRAVSTISESGDNGNIGAYMWMLPRMFPKRWQSTQRNEVKVDNSQTIEIVKYSDKNKNEDK